MPRSVCWVLCGVALPRVVASLARVSAVLVSSWLAADAAQEKPAAPEEQHRALVREYGKASLEFRNAATDEERNKAIERLRAFPNRFLDLARRDPKASMAADTLVEAVRAINAVDSLTQTSWEMSSSSVPAGPADDSARKLAELLVRDHLRSDKIGLVCERMRYGIRRDYESALRAILESNPHEDIQGIACLALAELLNTRALKLGLLQGRPELAQRFEQLLGAEDFAGLQKQGRSQLAREVEATLEKAIAKYGGVKLPYGGTVGETAGTELAEIRNLAIGKEALELEGQDQDARRFKLSDYRGKVVLLYFWSEY